MNFLSEQQKAFNRLSHRAQLHIGLADAQTDYQKLIKAIEYNEPSLVKFYLDAGVSANSEKGKDISPIYYAVIKKNPLITKMLLDYGANPSITNSLTHITLVESVFDDYDRSMSDRFITTEFVTESRNNLIMIAAILRNAGQRFDTPGSSNKSPLDTFGLWVGANRKAQVLAEFLEKIDWVDINSIRVTDIIAQSPEETTRLSPREAQSVELYRNGRYAEMCGSNALSFLTMGLQTPLMTTELVDQPQRFFSFQRGTGRTSFFPSIKNDERVRAITADDTNIGAGTDSSGIDKYFSFPGDLQPTEDWRDVAIDGDGFFQLMDTDGNIVYTRRLRLAIDTEGYLITEYGLRLPEQIQIPLSKEFVGIKIQKNGNIELILSDDSEPRLLGTIKLAKFPNPKSLHRIDWTLYRTTETNADGVIDTPGNRGIGTLVQQHIENKKFDGLSFLVDSIHDFKLWEFNPRF